LLSQDIADKLISMDKKLINCNTLIVPLPNESIVIEASSLCEKEHFLFDIWRGKIQIRKYKFQNRYSKNEILLRLDIVPETHFHMNPDGERIYGPHLHYYKEGFGDAWAKQYTSISNNFLDYIADFFKLCNVVNVPNIQIKV